MLPTIPTPVDPTKPNAANAPAKLDHNDAAKLRRAIAHVTHLYPGPAGKVLAAYLADWQAFAFRVDQTSLPAELVRDILRQLPEQR